MKNYVSEGEVVTLVAPYAVSSGQGVLVGGIFGVATSDAASGASVEVATTGVFDVTALSTDTPAQGAPLYWDNTNRRLTTTSTSNGNPVGCALIAKTNGQTTARVRLIGVVR